MHIIRNSRLDPDWAAVNRTFLTITQRAIATMIHYIGCNDVLRIYETTKRDGINYNLAYIETDFANMSAAVRQRSIALITFNWSRLTCPRLASRQAGP
jgi:hypothetical protein